MVLRQNPYAYPYKKIRGENNTYRIRVGKYRILYEIDKINMQIIILKVDKRERIYKND
ncbi:type II toxin-antitoxin system RelE/ParE family toxin [Aciduliprofundum sp. MAR08-339]|uniref:type II toxin-antitoxin system RelE family toxin n=1 Tax=Aciduliprofundum sp. (strain MAR08-339) TaxID=673860 RepID=UPI0026C81545